MSDCGCGNTGLNPSEGGGTKVKVNVADKVANYLADKIAAGAGITLAVLNAGGDEQLQITAKGIGSTPHDDKFFPIKNQIFFTLAAIPAVSSTVMFFVNGVRY